MTNLMTPFAVTTLDTAVEAILDASHGWALLPPHRASAHHDGRGEDDRSAAVGRLLDELCADLGFCLPTAQSVRLVRSGAVDVDEFTDAVFAAAGMRSDHFPHLRHQVRERVERGLPPNQVTVGSRVT